MTWGPTNPGQISGQSPPTPHVTTPAFPATTVFQQNTNPYPVQALISPAAGTTITHLYLSKSGTSSGAVDFVSVIAAATLQLFTIIIPAGWYLSATYSGSTIAWVWGGGL